MEARQLFVTYDVPAVPPGETWSWCPVCAGSLTPSHQAGLDRLVCGACGWVHYRNPVPGVVTLVERAGKVLLGRRGPSSYLPGLWCLPGGFMEWSEDYLSAGRREVREETGLEVEVRSILSVVSNLLTPTLHTLVVVLLATPTGGVEAAGDDLTELAWHTLGDEPPALAFEADRHIIARYAVTRLVGAPVDPRLSTRRIP